MDSRQSGKVALRSDWFYSQHGARLHFIEALASPTDFWAVADDYCTVNAVAACGRQTRWFMPGVFSRMGLPRCSACCKATHIKQGNGTPYNGG